MNGPTPPEKDANLWPAIFYFSVAYVVVSVLVGAVLQLLDVNPNSGVSIGILVGAVYVAVRKFVLEHQRPFTRGEQLRFSGLAFLATVLASIMLIFILSLVFIGARDLPAVITELPALVASQANLIAFALIIACLVSFAVLYFTSGWLSRSLAKKLASGKV